MPRTIDLAAYRTAGVLVFAGRDRGELVRAKARVEEADREADPVEIHVPEDVFGVTSSFFLGMLAPSVKLLGENKFRQHYQFTGKDISSVIDDGIQEALRTGSPL